MYTTESTSIHEKGGRDHLVDEPSIFSALRTILKAGIFVALATAVATAVLGWRMVPILCCFAAVALTVGLVLERRGWRRAGIMLGLTGSGYAALHAATFHGGLQNVGLVLIPLLLIVGSLVLDRMTLGLFTAGAILATGCMVLVENFVLNRGQSGTGDLGDFFVFAMICAITAMVGRMMVRRIHEGFQLMRASERQYRRIFENTQDFYFEMSPQGAAIEVSPSGASLLQTPREQIIGGSLSKFFCDGTEFARLLAEVAQNGRVTNRELGMRDSTGTRVEVLVNATLRRDGEQLSESIIGSIRDISDRRRAEEARRETEERLRLALDASRAGTFEVHPHSAVMLSETTKQHFGIAPETEATSAVLLAAIHPEDRDRIRRAYDQSAELGGDGQLAIEFRVVDAESGEERWLAARARMYFDEEGRPARVIGTTVDVTTRKNLDEQLRRRVEELQTFMEVAPVALFTATDAECAVVMGNEAACRMLETTAGSNLSVAGSGVARSWRVRVNGELVPDSQWPLQVAASGRDVRDCELEIELPSGKRSVLWGHASQLRDASGHGRGAIGAFLDITTMRKQAEDILRESETRFQNTADACPVMIWFGDREKRMVFINQQAARFTGVAAEELLDGGWTQVVHPDDLKYARTVYFDAVDRRAEYQLEYRIRRADGEYRNMLGTTRPRYFGREYAGQIGSVIDVTDVKRKQEETLTRQNMETIGVLASGIAHDFNNLLGGVLAQSEAALANVDAGQRPDEQLTAIANIAARGAEIVRQLMAYAGDDDESAGTAAVSQTVMELLELLRISTPKNAVLHADLPELPAVAADPSQIRQIVLNLVTNAAEALGGREGKIGVSARLVATTAAGNAAYRGDVVGCPDVELCVSDSGCGVSAEYHAKMFNPFFTTKGPGRGLGLAVVQGIVRTLNGSIRVESVAGGGTTVRVALPCAPAPIPARASTSVRPLPEQSERVSVLVVDDERFLRQAVAQILRKQGFTVTEASDGTAALEALREQNGPLDAVLLDITLPGASSRDVLAAAKNLRPQPKVIVTSAYSREQAADYLQTDIESFIRKPFRAMQLTDLLTESVGRAPNRPN